jgi:hypothetical protein
LKLQLELLRLLRLLRLLLLVLVFFPATEEPPEEAFLFLGLFGRLRSVRVCCRLLRGNKWGGTTGYERLWLGRQRYSGWLLAET